MIRLLPNPDFLAWLLAAIARAKKSVLLVNYLATLAEGDRTGPVARVAAALARARRCGVRVEIILEGSKFQENVAFYRRLKEADADVWMDTSLTFIHTKAVAIDGRLLCAGSHNLSASALTSHHELSIATNDRAALKAFDVELARMTEQKREISSAVCREGARVAIAPLIAIKRQVAPHAYLFYLLLCRIDGGRPRPIEIDADGWAEELGLPASVASAGVRIDAILDLMDRKLRVVKYDRKRNIVGRIGRKAKGKGRKDDVPFSLRPSPLADVLLPSTFWKFGWNRCLSVEALHLYLAGEAEKRASPFAPWWRLKRDEIAARYGFQKQKVNRAQMELKRAGLLEILFEAGGAPAGRFARHMNYFRQNPFYDFDVRQREIAALGRRFPARVFAAARRLVSLVGDDADAEKIEALCQAVSAVGTRRAERAARAILRLSPNSTKRTFSYAMELLGGRLPPENHPFSRRNLGDLFL